MKELLVKFELKFGVKVKFFVFSATESRLIFDHVFVVNPHQRPQKKLQTNIAASYENGNLVSVEASRWMKVDGEPYNIDIKYNVKDDVLVAESIDLGRFSHGFSVTPGLTKPNPEPMNRIEKTGSSYLFEVKNNIGAFDIEVPAKITNS